MLLTRTFRLACRNWDRAAPVARARRATACAGVLALAIALAGCESRVGAGDPRFVVAGPAPEAETEIVAPPTPLTDETAGAAPAARRDIGGTYPGTGRFIRAEGAAAPVLPADLPEGEAGAVSLNFVDTDLREVIKAVLGDILGLNYIIDPAVQGTVTMQTSEPLARAELLAALDEVLTVNGAAMIEVDGLYKIVPADRAARAGVVSAAGRPGGLGSDLSIVPLQHVSATEMEKILEPFAPPTAVLRVDPDRNLLVIGGTRSQRAQLLDLIDTFDVDWLAGMSYAIHPVETTTAEAMVEDLQKVFRGGEAEAAAGAVEFVPIDRLNAVLVMSPQRQYLAKAETWIRRLDVGDSTQPRVYVYYVQNARAVELADVLNQIFVGGAGPVAPRRDLAPGLEPTEITPLRDRDLPLGAGRYDAGADGSPDDPVQLAGLGSETPAAYQVTPDVPEPGAAPRPRVVRPRAGVAGADAAPAPPEQEIRIIPDPIKNALVIQATPRDYEKIQAVLQKLDIQSLQVLIEATFIEVGLTDELTLGTEWFFRTGSSELTMPPLLAGTPGAAGFFTWSLVTNNGDIRVTLQALQNVTEVTVVSSPNLMVLDNQEARIQVGGEEPVPTQSRQSITDPDAPIVSSIEYREVGTILSVTPRVNASGLVTLELEQEVSDVEEQQVQVGGTTAPAFNQRTIQSTIAVHDGESVVLGGQIFENKEKGKRGVPFLSQVPVLGFLFGTERSTADRTELLVIITPRVVRDESSARTATETLNRRMQRLRPLLEKFRVREGVDGA